MSIIPARSVDRRLLKAAHERMSPVEMSEFVHGILSPEECALRLVDILNSKTYLDEVQERRLLLIDISEHLAWLKGRREDSQSWNAISRTYKLLSDQIERTTINVEEVSTKLAEAHATIYVEAISIAMTAMLKALEERGIIDGEIEADQIPELMELTTKRATEYLDQNTQRAAAE